MNLVPPAQDYNLICCVWSCSHKALRSLLCFNNVKDIAVLLKGLLRDNSSMQQQYVAELHVVKELCFGSEDMVQQSNSSSLREQTGSIQQLEALLVQTTLGFWQESGQQRAVSVGYIKEDFSCGRRSAQQHTRRKTRAAGPRGHAVSQIGVIVFSPATWNLSYSVCVTSHR